MREVNMKRILGWCHQCRCRGVHTLGAIRAPWSVYPRAVSGDLNGGSHYHRRLFSMFRSTLVSFLVGIRVLHSSGWPSACVQLRTLWDFWPSCVHLLELEECTTTPSLCCAEDGPRGFTHSRQALLTQGLAMTGGGKHLQWALETVAEDVFGGAVYNEHWKQWPDNIGEVVYCKYWKW